MPEGYHNAYSQTRPALQVWQVGPEAFGPKELARYWSKVDRRGDSECWNWTSNRTGGKPGLEYGQFSLAHPGGTQRKRLSLYAHRVAWILIHGPIPSALQIRHSCDNAICCNPAHLELGTHTDNMQDAARRGRLRVSRPTRHKITTEQLATIDALLKSGQAQVSIARQFGVSQGWMSAYVNGHRRQLDRPTEEMDGSMTISIGSRRYHVRTERALLRLLARLNSKS